MRFAERSLPAVVLISLALSASIGSTEPPAAVHRHRYSMGTMFDILVHHASREDAARAVESALDEIQRLDAVMSHYKADSELMRLNRDARDGFVRVDASLYDVLRESGAVSRGSGGIFDVTVAPLLKMWRRADAEMRRPSAAEIAEARRCVGYELVDLAPPDRIRFKSDCVEIDLGGIGKGYAAERAMAILTAAGVRHAVINAGGSSITAIGAPPGRNGWPVAVGERVLLLRGMSLSTSRQDPGSTADPIVDPSSGAPAAAALAVSVIAPRATVADALSTALVPLSVDEGTRVAARFAGVTAIWTSPAGEIRATSRAARAERHGAH